jgi:hypothetical protein
MTKGGIMWRLAVLGGIACGCLVGCGAPEEIEAATSALLHSAGACPGYNDDEVCICANTNFEGTCKLLERATHFYANPTSLNPVGNDHIDSIAVGGNVTARFCIDGTFNAECAVLGAGDMHFNVDAITNSDGVITNFHDRISSMRVDAIADSCAAPGPGKVALFEQTNYGGTCVVFDAGNYPDPSATSDANGHNGSFGLKNDAPGSVIVGPLMRIDLYNGTNFTVGRFGINNPGTGNGGIPDLGVYSFYHITSSVKACPTSANWCP